MDREGLYKAAIAPPAAGLPVIKADHPPTATAGGNAKAEDGVEYGIIIIPPQEGQHNEEAEAYPEDYIKYCQGRIREHNRRTGKPPQWK